MVKSGLSTCANPFCGKKFARRTKKFTLKGEQIYCCKECSSAFTIGMIRMMRDRNLASPEALRSEIINYSRILKAKGLLARELGVDFKTLTAWADKLSLVWENRQYKIKPKQDKNKQE